MHTIEKSSNKFFFHYFWITALHSAVMDFNRFVSINTRQMWVVILLVLPIVLDAKLGDSRANEGRSLLSVLSYSSNPTDRYPLGRCRGDCDNDSHCKDGLVCFQRDPNEAVPGCDGGKSDSTSSDYCIDPDDLDGGDDDNNDDDDNDDDGFDDDDNDRIRNFAFKLYWDDYEWQEENFERKWCMECRGSCDEGDKTYISKCGRSKSERYDFVFVKGDYALIQVNGKNLCFERKSKSIYLRKCDKNKNDQLWFAKKGDFGGDRFEISPRGLTDFCVTQRHHPKEDEEVLLETCTAARKSDTSYWNRYY